MITVEEDKEKKEYNKSPDKAESYVKGYGKRPLWQWILIYVIIGGIIYGLIYYFAFFRQGSIAPGY